MQLNLESLRIPNLSIETGASRANVILPSRGQTNAVIEGGAARIEVTIPENVAARITVESGPNQIQVDQSRFPRRGNSDQYVSPNYDSATDRVNLRIEVGASHLTVQ
jgi:predicted membrane protein